MEMDKYHIYEEIGKGEFSQVYKGREKKRIEYVAIKRVEKSRMKTVVNEVQIMHKLQSPHILKFHDWYETRNSLWLILEYCAGGDLETLLKQDSHLPETSIRMFGLDLLAGLKYMHGLGLLHCDIRTKNVLVDEYGILKFADFMMTRRIPSCSLGDAPISTRGSPTHMAPELFLSDGVHSYQSDFWALGCILYELRRGFLPFGQLGTDVTMDVLIERINTLEPVCCPVVPALHAATAIPSVSSELADLLQWILEKGPMHRCDWEKLVSHPFWGSNAGPSPLNLPAQPMFDALARDLEKASNLHLQQASLQELGITQQEFDGEVHSHIYARAGHSGLPLALPKSDSTPVRPKSKSSLSSRGQHPEEAEEDLSRADRGGGRGGTSDADMLCSSVATTVAGGARTPPTATHSRPAVTSGADGGSAKSRVSSAIGDRHFPNVSSNSSASPSAVVHAQSSRPSPVLSGQSHSWLHDNGQAQAQHPMSTPVEAAAGVGRQTRSSSAGPTSSSSSCVAGGGDDGREEADQTDNDLLIETLLVHVSDTQVKPIVGNKNIETIERLTFKATALPFSSLTMNDIMQMTAAETEAHVTSIYKVLHKSSIAANPAAGQGSPSTASAAPGSAGVLMTLNALSERINILGYLSTISSSAEIANIVLNTHFLFLLLRLLRAPISPPPTIATNPSGPRLQQSRSTATGIGTSATAVTTAAAQLTNIATTARISIATILATILRFATFVQAPSRSSKDEHIIPSLIMMLKDSPLSTGSAAAAAASGGSSLALTRTAPAPAVVSSAVDSRLKKRAISALGEIVFYVAAQDEGGSSGGDVAEEDKWQLPVSGQVAIVRCLKDESTGSDETVRHYAAKTIENVLAQGSIEYRKKFATLEVAARLLELAQHSRNESLQATCGMALFHVFMLVMTIEPLSVINTKTGGNTLSPSGLNSTVSAPLTGAKFVSRVLDKGGFLTAMIETLRDGQPKLQQAYLNIILIVFCTFPSQQVMAATDSSLRSTRQYFLKTATLMPALLRLVEQGVTCIVKAKALLTVQVLCRHAPTLLPLLVEKRLGNMLVRVLDPLSASQVLTKQQTNSSDHGAAYLLQCAQSMVQYLRLLAHSGCVDLVDELQVVASCGSIPTIVGLGGAPSTPASGAVGTVSPGKTSHAPMTGKAQVTPATVLRHQTPLTSATTGMKSKKGAPLPLSQRKELGSPSQRLANNSACEAWPDAQKLTLRGEVLLAISSMCSISFLKYQVFAHSSAFVIGFCQALRILDPAQINVRYLASEVRKPEDKEWHSTLLAAVQLLEQNMLTTLESFVQIDLSSAIDFEKLTATSIQFLDSVTTAAIPAISSLVHSTNGDVRLVAASCLRRLVPMCVRSLQLVQVQLQNGETVIGLPVSRLEISGYESILQTGLSSLTSLREDVESEVVNLRTTGSTTIHVMLADVRPMPAYIIRTLADSISASSVAAEILARDLVQSGCLVALLRVLHKDKSGDGQVADDSSQAQDSQHEEINIYCLDKQFAILLRTLFERSNAAAFVMLENDLASCLVSAVCSCLCHGSLNNEYTGGELLVQWIDLLHVVLHFVIGLVAASNSASGGGSTPQSTSRQQHVAEKFRRLAAPMRPLCDVMVAMLGAAGFSSDCTGDCPDEVQLALQQAARQAASNDRDNYNDIDNQILHSNGKPNILICDAVSRCLGILFDLYPEYVSSHVLSSHDISLQHLLPDCKSQHQVLSPPARVVLSHILANDGQADVLLRLRIIKIIFGIVRMADTLHISNKMNDFLRSEPMRSALSKCASKSENVAAIEGLSDRLQSNSDSLRKIALQIIESMQNT